MANIPETISIDGELTKSTSQAKLVALLDMDKLQTGSWRGKDVIRQIYPADNQYLAYAETISGRNDLNTFARKRAGVGSWEALEKVAIFVINFVRGG